MIGGGGLPSRGMLEHHRRMHGGEPPLKFALTSAEKTELFIKKELQFRTRFPIFVRCGVTLRRIEMAKNYAVLLSCPSLFGLVAPGFILEAVGDSSRTTSTVVVPLIFIVCFFLLMLVIFTVMAREELEKARRLPHIPFETGDV